MRLSDPALIARLKQQAYARRRSVLSPETALRLAAALTAVIGSDRMVPRTRAQATNGDGLCVTIDTWTDDGGRRRDTLARFKTVILAEAAFAECVRQHPRERLTLRHGTRVVREHRP